MRLSFIASFSRSSPTFEHLYGLTSTVGTPAEPDRAEVVEAVGLGYDRGFLSGDELVTRCRVQGEKVHGVRGDDGNPRWNHHLDAAALSALA